MWIVILIIIWFCLYGLSIKMKEQEEAKKQARIEIQKEKYKKELLEKEKRK